MDMSTVGLLAALAAAFAAVWQARTAAAADRRERQDDRVEVGRWRERTEARLESLEARIVDRPRTAEVKSMVERMQSELTRRADLAAADHKALRELLEGIRDELHRVDGKLDRQSAGWLGRLRG